MHSLTEAFAAIASRAISLGTETVPLRAALERCLVERVTGRYPLPGFDNSAMDGYAVRFAEIAVAPSAVWTVCGESRAGGPGPKPLPAGQGMRIFTGAPTPEGADTVVIQENAEVGAQDRLAPVEAAAVPRSALVELFTCTKRVDSPCSSNSRSQNTLAKKPRASPIRFKSIV